MYKIRGARLRLPAQTHARPTFGKFWFLSLSLTTVGADERSHQTTRANKYPLSLFFSPSSLFFLVFLLLVKLYLSLNFCKVHTTLDTQSRSFFFFVPSTTQLLLSLSLFLTYCNFGNVAGFYSGLLLFFLFATARWFCVAGGVSGIEDDAVFGGLRRAIHETFLDVGGDGRKRLDDVGVVLGRRLEEFDAVLLGQGLATRCLNCLLVDHVALVANQDLVHVVGGVLLNVPDPVSNVLERLLVRDVVYEQDAHGTAVVRCRDRAKPFLASSIPDLQLNALAVQLDGLDLEVNADGGDEAGSKRVIAESQQQAAFPHTTVTDK